MRKNIAVCLAFCMLLGVMAGMYQAARATAFAEEQPGEAGSAIFPQSGEVTRYAEVVTAKGTLNMRVKAKDNAEIVDRLPRGSIVRILEDNDEWTRVLFKRKEGYVKTSFLNEFTEYPYNPLVKGDKGDAVLAFKRALHKLGYLKSEEINTRFDTVLENALIKLQLMNGVALSPELVTPELQALVNWGMIAKAMSGYVGAETDDDTGLGVTIFCWDTGGILYEADQSVKISISFAAQATGGQPPYTITVKKSLTGSGEQFADVVTSPFSHIWSQSTERLYVYATVVDSAGNTVTACAPYRYTMPTRYAGK